MNLPSGLVFYLDFKYGTAQPGFTADQTDPVSTSGHPFASPESDDSLFGVTNTSSDPTGGLYGAGRFGYSINDTSSNAAAATTASAATAGSGSVNFDSAYTNNLANHTVIYVSTASLVNPDYTAVRSFILTSGSTDNIITAAMNVPAFTKYNASTGRIEFVVATTASLNGTANYKVYYSKQPSDITRGDFEDNNPFKGSGASGINQGTDIDIPELNLELQSEPIVAKTRKLKAVWTPEFAQDLNAYHSIDAEAELTAMLSEYVSMEIDLEILDMLISSAATTDYWSARVGQEWNSAANTFVTSQFTGQAYIQGTWYATLGTKLQKVSNQIHAKTLRGGANFLVCSPDVSTILESIPGYAADGDGSKVKYAMGVQKVGALTSRYTV